MTFRVIGIGNAIMDVIAATDDHSLLRLGVQKGIMQLVDHDRAVRLTAAQGEHAARLVPGGSVANTLDGIARLGLSTAFIGRVADWRCVGGLDGGPYDGQTAWDTSDPGWPGHWIPDEDLEEVEAA